MSAVREEPEREVLMTELSGPDAHAADKDALPKPASVSSSRQGIRLHQHHLVAIAMMACSIAICAFLFGRLSHSCDLCPGCETPEAHCDIAIIGGGIGGVYSAQRLRSALPDKAVCLFEASNRIGGRLWSQTVPGAEGMPLEVGGMRFLPNIHRLVHGLATHLAMTWQTQPILVPGNYYVIRDTYLTWESYLNGSLPYYFTPAERQLLIERKMGPLAFYMRLVDEVLPVESVYSQWGACEWVNWSRSATFRGRPLRDLGMEYCLRQLMSGEALTSIADFVSFTDVFSQANAAEIITWERREAGASSGLADFYRFNEGYQQMPVRLLQQAESAGVRVFMNHTLTENLGRVSRSGHMVLRFADGTTVQVSDHVLYALPRAALEGLWERGQELETPDATRAIKSVSGVALFKLFLVFESDWWLGLLPTMQCTATGACGSVVHSDPERKVYFWGVSGMQPGAPSPGNRASAVLVTYTDGVAASFWVSMFAGKVNDGPYYLRPGAWSADVEPRNSSRVVAVEEAMRELRIMVAAANPDAEVPDPYAALYADWTNLNKGIHLWDIGADSLSARQALRIGRDVSVCGEAYSDMQGWVEGALRSCEALLTAKWALAPPAWFDEGAQTLAQYLSCA